MWNMSIKRLLVVSSLMGAALALIGAGAVAIVSYFYDDISAG